MATSVLDQVNEALIAAGRALKDDLWQPGDEAFLRARARDLVGLAKKAADAANEPARRDAFIAAARDTVESVKLMALIRMETGVKHLVDALGNFFLNVLVPTLLKILPTLVGLA